MNKFSTNTLVYVTAVQVKQTTTRAARDLVVYACELEPDTGAATTDICVTALCIRTTTMPFTRSIITWTLVCGYVYNMHIY